MGRIDVENAEKHNAELTSQELSDESVVEVVASRLITVHAFDGVLLRVWRKGVVHTIVLSSEAASSDLDAQLDREVEALRASLPTRFASVKDETTHCDESGPLCTVDNLNKGEAS